MAREETLFLERGFTWYNGRTIDSSDLEATVLEGKRFTHDDIDHSATGQVKPYRTQHTVTTIIVRNMASFALRAKSLVVFQLTAGVNRCRVDGMARLTAQHCAGYVDEYLNSSGCPQYDLCHVVIEGPAMGVTPLEGDAGNLIPVGTVLVSLTAATSGATTSGRARPQDLTGATALLADQAQYKVGMAMSAKTTTNTNADILIYVRTY